MRYCPDCGAECQDQDTKCLDCQFPLALDLLDQDGVLQTTRAQKDAWRRVLSLLKRSGLKIHVQTGTDFSAHQAWFIFPGIGLIFLLLSILFSESLARRFFPVPPAKVTINWDQKAPESPNMASESGLSSNILSEALMPTKDQLSDGTEDLEQESKPIVSEETVFHFAEWSSAHIRVASRSGYGTIFLTEGYLLTSYDLVEQVYNQVKGHFQEEGVFKQGTRTVKPVVEDSSGILEGVELLHRVERPPIGILKVENRGPVPFQSNFQDYPQEQDDVWVSFHQQGQLQIKRVRISGTVMQAGLPLPTLDFETVPSQLGHPVFNLHGEMIGILTAADEKAAILPNILLREKLPYIYRDIHRLMK
ncbi:MAG: hypothetical protein CSA81_04355 [Acidobacteria bacterium]|nr:MAG: hypothetical protein CSA81_04355 [Acidobacteriota bacterium]